MSNRLDLFKPGKPPTTSHTPGLLSTHITYDSNHLMIENGLATGSLMGMAEPFDEFGAYSNFNFFSDT